MSNSAVFFIPGAFLPPGSLPFLFTFIAADPRARGLAERREASSLELVAQVTRDATLARHGPSRATGRPAPRRSAVALSAQVPPPSPLPGPARRLHAPLARLPGCGCRAFRIRGYQPRSTPHPAPPSGSLSRKRPSRAGFGFVVRALYVVNYISSQSRSCDRRRPRPDRAGPPSLGASDTSRHLGLGVC